MKRPMTKDLRRKQPPNSDNNDKLFVTIASFATTIKIVL